MLIKKELVILFLIDLTSEPAINFNNIAKQRNIKIKIQIANIKYL